MADMFTVKEHQGNIGGSDGRPFEFIRLIYNAMPTRMHSIYPLRLSRGFDMFTVKEHQGNIGGSDGRPFEFIRLIYNALPTRIHSIYFWVPL